MQRNKNTFNANKVHGNKYDYSFIDYKNNKTKICIIYPEHGEFWQLANSHLKGCGCPKCAAMDYAYWLGELGFHHGYIEEISMEIMKHKQ